MSIIQRKGGHTFLVLQLDGDSEDIQNNRMTAKKHAVSIYDKYPRQRKGLFRLLWILDGRDPAELNDD